MSFSRINRRTHLYLGLLLLPWILMYGISSFIINHNDYFQKLYDDGTPQWSTQSERAYDRPVAEGADLTRVGADILAGLELGGDFNVRRPSPERIQIIDRSSWVVTRVTYNLNEQHLREEVRRFQWNDVLGRMHQRSGFHHDSVLQDAWAVVVDLTCIAFLVFIASGLYMWWGLRQTRLWGSLAIGCGVASFVALLVSL
jgi:hypothetical protein